MIAADYESVRLGLELASPLVGAGMIVLWSAFGWPFRVLIAVLLFWIAFILVVSSLVYEA